MRWYVWTTYGLINGMTRYYFHATTKIPLHRVGVYSYKEVNAINRSEAIKLARRLHRNGEI